ncbi:MAG: AAA family ATPase [Candidatus Aenigmatarchaeota archaeon]
MADDIKLKVGELTGREDFGRGIARIDSKIMKKLGVNEGEILEIEGKRKTGVVAIRSYPADIGLNILRVDGLVRKNCNATIGEFVTVRKAEAKEAKKVTLAPAQQGIMLHISPNLIKQNLFMRPMAKGDIITTSPVFKTKSRGDDVFSQFFGIDIQEVFLPMGTEMRLVVVKTSPDGITKITEMTEVEMLPEAVEISEEKMPTVTYEDIGGLGEIVPKIREMIEVPLRRPEVFERLGIEPPKGVLLHGPPGTGKTLIAKAVANESGAHFISLAGPEIFSKWYGQTEQNLRKVFDEAEKSAPSIIFIDEIDAIAPNREQVTGEVERRTVSQLLTLMDGLKSRGRVIVIAATNRVNALDPALRRSGRFDREIEIPVPNKKGRKEILQIHSRYMPLEKGVDLDKLAEVTYGYVGADIAGLAKEAAMHALRRVIPTISTLKEDEPIPKDVLEKLKVKADDFDYALRIVQPSAMREVLIEIPKVKWDEVGGLDDVKEALKESVIWPLENPESFKRVGIRPPRGILLYGPAGCGKTYVVKALANEAGVNFISIKGPELLCVSPDTKILTNHCGTIPIERFYENITPISKLIEKNENYEVRKLTQPVYTFAIGDNGEAVKTQVKTMHKLFVKDAYHIELKNNSELTGSANQPLLVYRNGYVQWIKMSEIKEGDYVSYPCRLDTLDKVVQIPLPKYEHLRLVKEDNDAYYVKIFSTNTTTRLPKYLTKNLAAFLGWFVSEGNVSEEAVTICNYNKANQNEIIKLFKQFVDGSRITVYKDRIIVYSMPLVKYLEQLLDQPLGEKKSHNIKCPSIIAKSTKDVITSFLKAVYRGDGSISQTKIEYSSKSKSLTEGIAYLTTILGIKTKFWKRKDDMYMLTISGALELHKFKSLVLGTDDNSEVRDEYNGQYEIPPVASLLKKIKQLSGLTYDKEIPDGSFEHVISGRRKIGLLRLQRIMRIFEKQVSDEIKQNKDFKTLQMIAKGDFLWTTVVKKAKTKAQIMYDVETEHHSFIGGNIPMLLHNSKWVGESEQHVRDVFRRAKQVAPAIILFDEIDSLAPKRGMSSGSHVTEQVVSQLLTEMSGIEDMEGVSVIATTNRPDILDSALLRPGRFDRLIYVPAPDEKTREDILKIHTKNMPLKGVNLGKIAKETDKFSGADIEALVREAALFALRENKNAKEVASKHFEKALKRIKPSITEDPACKYKKAVENLKKTEMDDQARYIG